jgi:hypothetical protein
MTKDEALKMCLEYIETDAHERKYVRHAIKKALAQPEPPPECKTEAEKTAYAFGWFKSMEAQRTWVGLTPACPNGLTQYECEVEGVDLVCFLEYTPDEEGSRDSYGLLNEPGTSENLELVNAYVKGTDVDIGHLLLQYLVDHITTTAFEDFKNDDY